MEQEMKAQFRNRTTGYVGVNVINEEGKEHGAAVDPGGTVWLSEREQMMTANAPRKPENNPFVGGHPDGGPALELITELRPIGAGESDRPIGAHLSGDEPEEKAEGRPKSRSRRRQSEETGAAAAPKGDAAEGSFATGEEVGDPEAPKAA